MQEDMIKELPRGKNDFTYVRKNNMYYVDKTWYIKRLDKSQDFLILNRPRRFGKSLFISALEKYADIKTTDEEFEELFKGLYIYDNPSVVCRKYMVMRLDFSKVKAQKTYKETEEEFSAYMLNTLQKFIEKYNDMLSDFTKKRLEAQTTYAGLMNVLTMDLEGTGNYIYLIIDEYDNFTNDILARDRSQYREITHSIGFLRYFFKLCKTACIDHILLVGIAPVTHDDLTSGMGYCDPIGTMKDYNGILGFTETEVRELVDYYQEHYHFDMTTDEIIADMKPWYDNYRFTDDKGEFETVYNTDAVIMYMNSMIETSAPPKNRVDQATATDWNKMLMIAKIGSKTISTGEEDETTDKVTLLDRIAKEGRFRTQIVQRFDMERLADANVFPSLLYFFGFLTIESARGGMVMLTIPNNNIRKQFYEYFLGKYADPMDRDYINRISDLSFEAAYDGNWKELFGFILEKWRQVSSLRQAIEGERAMQSFVMALLSLNNVFMMRSEMEMNKGYSDIVLFPDFTRYDDVEHSYIIELKVAKADATTEDIDKIKGEAVAQAEKYAKDDVVPAMVRESRLHKCVIVLRGWEVEVMEEV